MPRSPSPSPSPSPERHPPVRRRGSGASHMQLQNHNHRRRSPSPSARRSLRPRRAAAASSRPLVDDFFPFPSSPSSSPSRTRPRRPSPEPSSSDSGDGGGGACSVSDRRRRKLKLVVKLSQLPPDQQHRRVPPPPPYSDDSDGEEDGSGDEEQVKPPKKRRIEPRGDRSRRQEVGGGRSEAASAPRTKRLPVPGILRTTPLPGRNTLDLILDKLQKKDTYGVFADPVDPEELPDYHDVIEHPMDFSTVRRKLARNVYRSFEQFEDDIFLICSNAMQYNAPDTIYFRQAHSIQELARKKFQELRDEGIQTENQIRSEQKFRPNSCNREPIKKPVLRYSDDDIGFLPRKEQVKRPNLKVSEEDDTRFKGQVKKPISRTVQDESSIFHKERVKKQVSKNSEGDLSSSIHKERAKKLMSRNSEDDLSSSVRKEKVRKAIYRNSENDGRSSFHKQHIKKPASQSFKDDFSSHKKPTRKPICGNSEDPYFSSRKEPFENSVCTNGEDSGVVSTKRLAETPIGEIREDNGHSRQNSSNKHICRKGQDNAGYSSNEEVVAEPVRVNSQGTLGSDVSGATIASAGDGSNGLSTSQAHATEPAGCSVGNGVLDKGISSPQDDIKSEKADDIPAKPSYKSIVVDETRRKTYDTSEEQLPLESDPIFDVFSAERKELINVGVHSDHEYAYARSLARFAGSLGAQGWRIASERIRQALPANVKYGRGWVGNYEPLLQSVLIVNDQRNLKSSEGNVRRNASLPGDNEKFKQTERNSAKDMSLLNRMDTGNNVLGVPGPLESPEFKPRIFGVTAEPLHKSTNALSPHENHRVTGNVAKAKRRSNGQMRKCNSSSGARLPEIQLQRPDCSKGATTAVLDVPSLNKGARQPRPFSQPSAVRSQEISKNSIPIETVPQQRDCTKSASIRPSLNGQPKPFFQSQEATTPQPRNEAAWVYHGRPGDAKVGISNKSGPSTSAGFISNNQAVNAANFAMSVSGQKNFIEHAKSVGSTVAPGQANILNRGHDTPRNMFSAFPAAVRENQGIPSAQGAQSWISFGASENRPAIVSPTVLDSNSGWKMPFANVHPADNAKISAVPQFFMQPVQVAGESPAQNKGLVIFPQLVQTDLRSQGQPQWQGLVPHLQQKPSKDVLRPDLNIGFPSPGSPPARQSSGINLEAQQPDLALQL